MAGVRRLGHVGSRTQQGRPRRAWPGATRRDAHEPATILVMLEGRDQREGHTRRGSTRCRARGVATARRPARTPRRAAEFGDQVLRRRGIGRSVTRTEVGGDPQCGAKAGVVGMRCNRRRRGSHGFFDTALVRWRSRPTPAWPLRPDPSRPCGRGRGAAARDEGLHERERRRPRARRGRGRARRGARSRKPRAPPATRRDGGAPLPFCPARTRRGEGPICFVALKWFCAEVRDSPPPGSVGAAAQPRQGRRPLGRRRARRLLAGIASARWRDSAATSE